MNFVLSTVKSLNNCELEYYMICIKIIKSENSCVAINKHMLSLVLAQNRYSE